MAKKDKNKPPKRGDMSWMDEMAVPTQAQFQRYLQGQRGQFAPTIATLRNQMAMLRRQGDPTVRAAQSMLAALPSSEAVSQAYGSRLGNVSEFIRGLDMSRAGRGVSEAIGAIGGALGVQGAGNIAQAAGTVSGIGEAGGDVMSKAIMAGAAGQFAGLETERLGQLAEQRQGLTMTAAEARKAAREQRMELGRMLAQARGERRAAAPNPFEVANMIMQFQQNRRAMSGGGRGTSGGSAAGAAGDGDTVDVTSPQQIQNFLMTGGANQYLPMPGGGQLRPGYYGASRPAPGRR